MTFQIQVSNQKQDFKDQVSEFPIEIGRGRDVHPQCSPLATRKIIVEDEYASRHHCRLESDGADGLVVVNLSAKRPVVLSGLGNIEPGQKSAVTESVFSLKIGETDVNVQSGSHVDDKGFDYSDDEGSILLPQPKSHSQLTRDDEVLPELGIDGSAPNKFNTVRAPNSDTEASMVASISAGQPFGVELVSEWLQRILELQISATSSNEFYDHAAEAAVKIIGFDHARVLLREKESWVVRSRYSKGSSSRFRVSDSILKRLLHERQAQYGSTADLDVESVTDVSVIAAAPIFDATRRKIIGALYGSRTFNVNENPETAAKLLQVLASIVSLGMAREEREDEAAKAQARFSQFFTDTLARELQNDESLLDGQIREITVMFCDLRGFSSLGLSPQENCKVIREVLECLTEAVREYDGVVVDYAGDGMMAIWNAPLDQPNHADLAAKAAIRMTRELPVLSAKWESELQKTLKVGVGIHSGEALVGNTGTTYKFKYGASGKTVNLASRIESATKTVGVPILISERTHELLTIKLPTRRLLKVRLPGFPEAIQLYELNAADEINSWNDLKTVYEESLACLEKSDFGQSCEMIQPMVVRFLGAERDLPTLTLASMAINCIRENPEDFEAVLNITRK